MTPRYARARILAGLSLRQAARRLDLAPSYLSAFEHGRDVPEPALQLRMAQLYEAGLPWLLGEAPELAPDSALPANARLSPEERRDLLELIAMGVGR
jgi:transcriptional regulator with XRE-family HTH domain